MGAIGYQNGITAAMNRLRDLDPKGTILVKSGGKWPSIDTIQNVPLENWKAWDKLERTLTILKDDHDGDPDPPDPPDPPLYKLVAPLVAYEEGGSNARFCFFNPDGTLRPGVARQDDGTFRDEVGWYDADGLQKGSERNEQRDPAYPQIVGAREINGRPLCELPMAGDRTKNTGSWRI